MDADYGGNRVIAFDPDRPGVLSFAEEPYSYRIAVLSPGERLALDGLDAWVVFALRGDARLAWQDRQAALPTGASALGGGTAAALVAGGAGATLLIGGAGGAAGAPGVTVTPPGGHYRVDKPWGHELWITGEHPLFCLKEVMLRAGQRSSLQYHEHKSETIVLVDGDIRLVFQTAGGPPPYTAMPATDSVALRRGSTIHISPGTLHRIEAVTDALLYEVATPHLDDVVRVQDDKARADGRIAAEHAGRA